MRKGVLFFLVMLAAASCGRPEAGGPAGADSSAAAEPESASAPVPPAHSAVAPDTVTLTPAFSSAGLLARADLLNLEAMRTVRYGLDHIRNEMIRSLAWRLAGDHAALRDEFRRVARDARVRTSVDHRAVTVPPDVLQRVRGIEDAARQSRVYLDELDALYAADIGVLRSVLIPAAYSSDLRDLLGRDADILAEHRRKVDRLRAALPP